MYAVSREPLEREKASRALGILDATDLALSAQVLQEFYVQATRPTREDPLDHEQAVDFLNTLLDFHIPDVTTSLVLSAIATHHRFRISYWDAAIIEAARSMGADVVLSEDLGDGQDYAGVRVENPFIDG